MKSAYELAMERLEKRDGKSPPLTDAQKAALAEVDQTLNARLAEIEIMWKHRLVAARASGDTEAVRRLEEEQSVEREKAKRKADEEKQRIRASGR